MEGLVDGVIAEPATTSTRSDEPPGPAKLRAMPAIRAVTPRHPLRIYLEVRGVGIAEGASLLAVSERLLREVLAHRRRFPNWREQWIARYLREEPAVLFPVALDDGAGAG